MTAPRPKAVNPAPPWPGADQPPAPSRLITRRELAERLGVSERTVMRMEASGHLPPRSGSASNASGTGPTPCPVSPDEKKTRRRPGRTATGEGSSHRPILPRAWLSVTCGEPKGIAMETYSSAAAAFTGKALLSKLLNALDASPSTLRLDACRLWTLQGRRGYLSTWGDGTSFLIALCCPSALAWAWAKKRLAFCAITQDGDSEGVLRLRRLPNPDEATEIRDLVGLRKRTLWTDPEAARMRGVALALNRKPATTGRGVQPRISGEAHLAGGEVADNLSRPFFGALS